MKEFKNNDLNHLKLTNCLSQILVINVAGLFSSFLALTKLIRLVICTQVIGCVLSTVDFALWLLTLGPVKLLLKLLKSHPKILPVGDKPDAPRRRITGSTEFLGRPVPEISTLYEIILRSKKEHP